MCNNCIPKNILQGTESNINQNCNALISYFGWFYKHSTFLPNSQRLEHHNKFASGSFCTAHSQSYDHMYTCLRQAAKSFNSPLLSFSKLLECTFLVFLRLFSWIRKRTWKMCYSPLSVNAINKLYILQPNQSIYVEQNYGRSVALIPQMRCSLKESNFTTQ